MPTKICPECKASCGPRTLKCACGYNFFSVPAVSAAPQKMQVEPLDKQITGSVSAVRNIIDKVENRSFDTMESLTEAARKRRQQKDVPSEWSSSKTPLMPQDAYVGGVQTPAGLPPHKPQGYKDSWPDGPASDEVIREWAIQVLDSGRFSPSAVVYWARYFWDINSPEYLRVRSIILDTCLEISEAAITVTETESETDTNEVTVSDSGNFLKL